MNTTKTSLSFWILLSVTLFFNSCDKDREKKEITRIVTEWQNKEIIFPTDIVFTRYGQDTLNYQIPESDYKILLYVDSVGCTSCKLQLHRWSEFVRDVKVSTQHCVPVLFFFHPKDKRELTYLLRRDELDIPVCIDDKDRLNKLNNFPSRDNFQCFLLDKNNKVVYIGNPVYNHQIREMYLSRIIGKPPVAEAPPRNTSVRILHSEFDLGVINRGEPVSVIATIHNVGEAPFIIYDTKQACGCTEVSYPKTPTIPSSSLEIEMTYNVEDKGYFNKTVSIYGNIENNPIILRLKGVAQ